MIRIGPLQVDLTSRELLLDGQPVRIGSRAFDMFAVLIAAKGELVSKNDMLKEVWPDTIVEENNLQVHMSALRKVLGESRGLIQTVSGRGYRLVARQSPVQHASGVTLSGFGRDLQAANDRQSAAAHIPHNLPASFSPLIGRDDALRDVAQALASARHVTLLGAGGIGKTRLAVEVARRLLDAYPDGVYLIPLASTSDANSVLAMFAASVGVSKASGPLTLTRVSSEWGERRVLCVIDNCEHVLGPAAELADALLNAGPGVRVLTTSREPLRLAQEHLYWVASLDVPAHDDQSQQVLERSAVQLFLSRARAMDARFSSDERSIQLTGTVCRRLDGIPLAIELAAARAATLGIETLADHLDDRFDMLTGGNRTALPRHQTLKATLDWSHGLLDDAERATLRRLGIFVNSFSIDAAIAVAADSGLQQAAVIAAVSGLVEKSLVVARVERGKASYRLLETTRAYALQKLDDNGERRAVTLNHARYFTGLLERHMSAEARLSEGDADADADRWHARMRGWLDDLRAALGWALSSKGDDALAEKLAVKVVALLYELSLVDECCAWARRALESVAHTHGASGSTRHLRVRMQLLAALGAALVYVNGPNRETLAVWAEVLALAIALADRAFEARALWGMWNASQSSGAARNALAFAHRFASLAAQTGDTSNGILAARLLGIAWHYAGNQQQARASLERFLLQADTLQHGLPLGQSIDQGVVGRATLARLLWFQGARDEALDLAQACVASACAEDQAIVTCYVLVEAEIPLALLSGQRERAADAIALLRDVSARTGLGVSQACARCFQEYLRSFDDVSPARLQAFRAALDELDALEYAAQRAMLVAQYALALGRAGRREEAIAAVTRALAQCDESGDHWYVVELRRVQGELLLQDANVFSIGSAAMDANACLTAAMEESLAQGCASLQLRAATSLGRLWCAQGRAADAVRLIESACAKLTQGLDFDDFQAALQLLETARASAAMVPQCAHREGEASAPPPVGRSRQPRVSEGC
jgi:predicted ATPase/DNA-binding winged helix-turn-helix (wHTH) protein